MKGNKARESAFKRLIGRTMSDKKIWHAVHGCERDSASEAALLQAWNEITSSMGSLPALVPLTRELSCPPCR